MRYLSCVRIHTAVVPWGTYICGYTAEGCVACNARYKYDVRVWQAWFARYYYEELLCAIQYIFVCCHYFGFSWTRSVINFGYYSAKRCNCQGTRVSRTCVSCKQWYASHKSKSRPRAAMSEANVQRTRWASFMSLSPVMIGEQHASMLVFGAFLRCSTSLCIFFYW